MTSLLLLVKNNFLRQAQYRVSFFGYLLITCVLYSAQFIFFRRLFDFNKDLGDYSVSDISLMLFTFISVNLIVEFFSGSIESFFNKVYHGGIEPYLTKPISLVQLILFGWCFPLNFFVLAGLQLLVIFGVFKLEFNWNLLSILAYATSVVFSVMLNICFILLLNLLTFVVQRKLPVDYIHSKIFELSMVPTSLYPRRVFAAILLFVPSALSASVPVQILVQGNYSLLAVQAAVLISFLLITKLSLRKALMLFEGVGG